MQKKRRLSDFALERMATLLERLAARPSMGEICQGAMELLGEVFGFPYIEIFEVDQTSGEMRAKHCTDAEASKILSYTGRIGEGIVGHVAQSGELVLLSDAKKDPRFIPFLKDSKAELAVPIRVGGKVRFVLNIESPKPDGLANIDLGLIETLAGIIGAGFLLVEEAEKREALSRMVAEERDAARGIAASLQKENLHLKVGSGEKIVFENIIGISPAMQALLREMEAVKETHATVLVEGETGSGKELVARTLHQIGPRRSKPFVSVNSANLQANLFESELFGHLKGAFTGAIEAREGLARAADGGTLFLDEVGELGPENQAKLLRFLDYKEVRAVGSTKSATVDVRIIAATNRDLAAEVKSRFFREDLYYRLKVIHLKLPSLRERREDLSLLIHHFLGRFALRDGKSIAGISEEAMDLLMSHSWAGNVRELKNEMERVVALTPSGQKVRASSLSPAVRDCGHAPGGTPISQVRSDMKAREFELVSETLTRTGWNVSKAAAELGISRVGMTKKIKTLGLNRPK